jgi:NAD(P)-dependent dehydrogenase (short-subunit alcohol dehydrogenase family)
LGRNEVEDLMVQKIVLITGATGGIGKQTALSLAKMGATVVITGRSLASGEAAVLDIKHASGNSKVDLMLGDLTSMKSIRALVEQFSARFQRLDVLINNAGTASPSRTLTEDGVETNFAVNVLAPYLLTSLLMDRLSASPSARVITLMGGETPSVLNLDNLQGERSFDGLNSYSQSKLAMMA